MFGYCWQSHNTATRTKARVTFTADKDDMNLVKQDVLLMHLHDQYGPKWNQISEVLRIHDAKKRFEELNQRLESDIIEILKYHQGIITESSCGIVQFKVRTILPLLVKLWMERSSLKTLFSLRPASPRGEQCSRCGLY